MTVKMTISLPDNTAAFVRSHGNASAFIAHAVDKLQIQQATRAALDAVGIREVPAAEYERIHRSVVEADARRGDPERRAQLDARLAEFIRRPDR